jgi:hypothetical protein
MKASVLSTAALVMGLFLSLAPATGQPLVNPFPFAMSDSVDLTTDLLWGAFEKAGERGRITVKDGHLHYPYGTRSTLVGTTVHLTACFPDSATAIDMARRLRALGVNTVQFFQFDYTYYQPYSIFAPGESTLGGGLHAENMKRFDWFMYQLRENGIYYGFVFHSIWRPRPGDGVRDHDSTGWGARTPIWFDKRIQQIHRDIMGALLRHENPYTGLAYKDDPALLYVMPIEEPSFDIYWMYTKDIYADNRYGSRSVGFAHLALMDSLFNAFVRSKGYTIDAQLENAWRQYASNPANQLRNGDFENPFDQSAWAFQVNSNVGAQAIFQYVDNDKHAGTYAGKVLVGAPSNNGANSGIYLLQSLTEIKRGHAYQFRAWLKTSAQQQKRRIQCYVYNSTVPYEGYGLNETFEITSQWKEYTFEFVAKSSVPTSANLIIYMGMDPGDVYLDDVSFRDVNIAGLQPGESIANGTVRRSSFWDGILSPKRAEHLAEFYLKAQEGVLESARKYIKDTLGCDVMLAPGRRMYSARDRYAARNYDFFTTYDFRSSTNSFLDELYGASMWVHTAQHVEGKPYVISGLNTQYPRPYHAETAVIFPSYAGLQDWDGVHFSYFTGVPRAGHFRVDSNFYWQIYDKPHLLTLLPAASNMLRRGDVGTSSKVLTISNDQESLTYPQFHSNQAYSLSVGGDGRMGLFRRIEMNSDFNGEESFLPHLDISSLSGTVDPSAYNAENEQIFFDATQNIIRVITPRYKAIVGRIAGKIVTEAGIIVEQVSAGDHTTVVVSSLTDDDIETSTKSLLVVGSRGVNEDAVFNQDNTGFTIWGKGRFMMEGRTVRVTLSAPTFDSCWVTPLGTDGRPIVARKRSVDKSRSGRFSVQVETNVDGTPWYVVEFSKIPTSVSEGSTGSDPIYAAYPNPVVDGRVTITSRNADDRPMHIVVYDVNGRPVRDLGVVQAGDIGLHGLAAGLYQLVIDDGKGRVPIVIY